MHGNAALGKLVVPGPLVFMPLSKSLSRLSPRMLGLVFFQTKKGSERYPLAQSCTTPQSWDCRDR
jgi:hypothetical protein